MTILGQDWLCDDRSKHYLGRQSALSYRSMTNFGQEWLCIDGGMTNFGQDWLFFDESIQI